MLWLRAMAIGSGVLVAVMCWYAPDVAGLGLYWPLGLSVLGTLIAGWLLRRGMLYFHAGLVASVAAIYVWRFHEFGDMYPFVLLSYLAVLFVSYASATVMEYVLRSYLLAQRSKA